MKMNKSKIVVSALAVCMGAALVGSVSGTVAWYQYSTKATTAMMGTAAGVSRNLEIKIGSASTDWKQELTTSDIATWLATAANTYSKGDTLAPVTTGEMDKDVALPKLKGNPIYQYAAPEQWDDAKKTDYVVLPLYVRAVERDADPDSTPTYVAKNIYLTDLTIENKSDSGKEDITKAVRVHFSSGGINACASLDGTPTDVYGNLDLNGDGELDRVLTQRYDFQYASGEEEEMVYGVDGKQAKTYKSSEKGVDKLIADDTDADSFKGGKQLCTTATNENGTLITVTIYLEGWQKFADSYMDSETKTIWDLNSFVGSQFYVGMTFGTPSEGTNEVSAS